MSSEDAPSADTSKPVLDMSTYKIKFDFLRAAEFFGSETSVEDISLDHLDPVFLAFDGVFPLRSTTRLDSTTLCAGATVSPVADSPSAGPLRVAVQEASGDGGKAAPPTTRHVESPPTDVEVSEQTYFLLQNLRYASLPGHSGDHKFAVLDFARELLRAHGFQSRTRILRTRYPLAFLVDRDVQVAYPDISLVGTDNAMVLLLVQTELDMIFQCDVEQRLVTAAIAAFNVNNKTRSGRRKPKLEKMVFPGIVMVRSRPTFYTISITEALDLAVGAGIPVQAETHVAKCVVPSWMFEGMEVCKYRADALRHLIAFKALAESFWAQYD